MLRKESDTNEILSLVGWDRNAAEWLILFMNLSRSIDSLCFDHVRQLAGIGRDFDGPANPQWWRGQNTGRPSPVDASRRSEWSDRVGEVIKEADECANCLRWQWEVEFLDANSKVPRDGLESFLRERARLKNTFPGYGFDSTPRERIAVPPRSSCFRRGERSLSLRFLTKKLPSCAQSSQSFPIALMSLGTTMNGLSDGESDLKTSYRVMPKLSSAGTGRLDGWGMLRASRCEQARIPRVVVR